MTQVQAGGRSSLTIKAHNRRTLLLALLREQPISRVRLARTTGLSTTTVTNLVAELTAQGVVTETGMDHAAAPPGAGRRPRALELVADSRYVIGVHIGVRRIKIALCNLMAEIIDCVVLPVQAGQAPDVTLHGVTEAIRTLRARNGLDAAGSSRLLGVGVGASGLVDMDAGVNVLAPNLGWRQVPLRDLLGDVLDLPVTVDNNVRCMALAESLYGAGLQTRALAFVYARIGVGAGLVVDGQVYRGAGYGAGEIGHWVMVAGDAAGNLSLEELISERRIVALVEEQAPEVLPRDGRSYDPIQAIFAAARAGHPLVR
ncbi:MAG: ROK family protein, partial [Caldilineaceae bacterium]|nr:ROK family protein [Caldilineaceae bacterium]